MEAHLKLLKFIKPETRDLVNGFVRSYAQNLLPLEIVRLILSFYFSFMFNLNQCGDNLKFSADGQSVQKLNDNGWSTAIYGSVITNEICDMFEICFKCGTGKDRVNHIFGYIPDLELMKKVDWNDAIGAGSNEKYSIGILAHYDTFILFDEPGGCPWRYIEYETDEFESSDTWRVSFSFVENVMSIYHNDNLVEKVSLNGFKSIIPVFCLELENDTFNIINYAFK